MQPQPQRVQPYQQRYRQPGGYGNTYGAVALVCGIIGLFCGGFILGIVAIVLGGIGLNRDESKGMAIVGLILGIIDFACSFLLFFWIFSWFSFLPFGF
jgi:tetrahydromethanopterin S-methyltransferase subunit D